MSWRQGEEAKLEWPTYKLSFRLDDDGEGKMLGVMEDPLGWPENLLPIFA